MTPSTPNVLKNPTPLAAGGLQRLSIKWTLALLCLFALTSNALGQTTLDADGPGNTYDLITSVLAPGYNPIETPDCNHNAFGDHIDEIWDSILNTNVFRFHIHVSPDNDRCINFDRQRNEIKTYDKSPANLRGSENEIVVYEWKFKLNSGFQSSPNFTHIHQLKSVGGSLASMPMYTLTTRKSSPDRLELRYAETSSQTTLAQTSLSPLTDVWIYAKETVQYSTVGSYSIELRKVSDSTMLFNYSNDSIVNWRPGADFVRPKWGVYRSLINSQDLRDETVLFANFSIHELGVFDVPSNSQKEPIKLYPNPSNTSVTLSNIPEEVTEIVIRNERDQILKSESVDPLTPVTLDTRAFPQGTYIIDFYGGRFPISKKLYIQH